LQMPPDTSQPPPSPEETVDRLKAIPHVFWWLLHVDAREAVARSTDLCAETRWLISAGRMRRLLRR
jgi:hypothetical protein